MNKITEAVSKNQLGQILMRMGKISDSQLEIALKIKNDNPEKLLGEIIVEIGFVNNEVIVEALNEQKVLNEELND